MLPIFIISFYVLFIPIIKGTHFLGGTITWRPLNASATGSPIAIVITQTYLWNYTAIPCTNAMIANHSFVPNYLGTLSTQKLQCITNCGAGAAGYPNISIYPYCTDFSASTQTTVGQRSDIVYLQAGDDFSAAFMSSYWRTLTTVLSGNWSLATTLKITPRPDNGLYNSAPVATIMSPIYATYNQTTIINIPVADADGDNVRCRWANNSNGINECGGVCPLGSLPPNTVLFPNCTIITTAKNISDWYAFAVVVEDFINSTSTTPLSSIPIQFLVNVVNSSTCPTPPDIIGIPPELSCTPILVGQTFTTDLIAINSCGPTVSILDIATLSFPGVTQTNITKLNFTTFYKSFTWTPTIAQLGYQVMCAMAVDSQNAQSSQYCFTFYVSQNTSTGCPGINVTTTSTTTTTTSTSSTTTTTSISSTTTTTSTISTTTTISISSTATTPTTSASTTTSITTTTSNTSTSLSLIIETTTPINDSITWPLIGSIIGFIFLLGLISCLCLCYFCLRISIGPGYNYKSYKNPVLYHIEPCSFFYCYSSDNENKSNRFSLLYANNLVDTNSRKFIDNYNNIENTSISPVSKTSASNSIEDNSKSSYFDTNNRSTLISRRTVSNKPILRVPVATNNRNTEIWNIGYPNKKPFIYRKQKQSINTYQSKLESNQVSDVSSSNIENIHGFNYKLHKDSVSNLPTNVYKNPNSDKRNYNQITYIRSVPLKRLSHSSMHEKPPSTLNDSLDSDGYDNNEQMTINSKSNYLYPQSTEKTVVNYSSTTPIETLYYPVQSKRRISDNHVRVQHLPRLIDRNESSDISNGFVVIRQIQNNPINMNEYT